MASETERTVRQIIAEVTEDEAIGEADRLQVDSLQALRILIEIENRFGVEVDEVTMFNEGWFETPPSIAEYLDRLLVGQSA